MPAPTTIQATDVLTTGNPETKAQIARQWRAAVLDGLGRHADAPPARPERPKRPELVPPAEVRKRGLGKPEGRAALLHAIAHIELNAIDLAADMVARFADADELVDARDDFILDWSSVCDDEARHFLMIEARLAELGFSYGDFPAHDGLWAAAQDTQGDVAARLAVAPLVLEARGLDVTPGMIKRLDGVGDRQSADVLRVIYAEEIGHVATGIKWFTRVARAREQDPQPYFTKLVREHFKGRVKPPFNVEARAKAQFPAAFYESLAS